MAMRTGGQLVVDALRSTTAVLRSGAGDGVEAKAALPRLRWRGSFQPGGAWSEARSLRARLRSRMFISG